MATPLRLLVVEDAPADAEMMMHELRRAGFDPDWRRVDTERDLLAHLEPGLEIILADFQLPGFDAFRLLELLQEARADVPVLIVSGTIGDELAVELLRKGATDYLLKDRLARLGPAVTQALRQREILDAKRRAEQALRESEARFRSLLESAPDAVVTVDRDGRIVLVNQQAEKLFQYDRHELLGQPVEMLVPARFRQTHVGHRTTYTGSPHARPMGMGLELTGQRKDGSEFSVEISLSPLAPGNTGLVISSIRDITERKRLEAQFHQAQKLDTVGKLAGGIAHDFNNLLTAILGYSGDLLDESARSVQLPRHFREGLEEIHRAGQRAAALTQQLLAFSRKQVVHPTVLSLNAVLADIEPMLRRLIREDIDLQVRLDPDLGLVRADGGQIEQVLMNVVVNARDAMPTGGKLMIETSNVDLDAAYARAHVAVIPGRHVMLAVSDNGIGMTAHVQASVFEPFFTTKPHGQGTGLGLATVYGIVKQSGGNIWLYSEPGKGTTFKIYLPCVDEPLEEAKPRSHFSGASTGSETVLLAEDEDAVRELTRQVLTRQGYTVLAARSGEDALRVAADYAGPVHLLVTDVIMPGMNGRVLAERLIAQRPDLKVLYISGYTDNAIVHHGVLAPGVVLLQKPFTPKSLAQAVREILDAPR